MEHDTDQDFLSQPHFDGGNSSDDYEATSDELEPHLEALLDLATD